MISEDSVWIDEENGLSWGGFRLCHGVIKLVQRGTFLLKL
jgi:hypothetical protein